MDWYPLYNSVRIALISTVIIFFAGIAAAYYVARLPRAVKGVLDAVFTLPLVLLLTIESGIWINLSIPYFMGESVNFIGYLVINTVQLGATIDYGILLTTHYLS